MLSDLSATKHAESLLKRVRFIKATEKTLTISMALDEGILTLILEPSASTKTELTNEIVIIPKNEVNNPEEFADVTNMSAKDNEVTLD